MFQPQIEYFGAAGSCNDDVCGRYLKSTERLVPLSKVLEGRSSDLPQVMGSDLHKQACFS